jgi:hypothetical protein|tara:strand:+ start:656 stop:913 length:258 start_codon:yes stop_codon:yes gene_type:complete
MKWLIVVVFANLAPNGDKEMFVFTNPTFDDPYECQADISNPQVIPLLTQKIIEENGTRPIERVMCLPEKSVNELLNYKKEKGTSA